VRPQAPHLLFPSSPAVRYPSLLHPSSRNPPVTIEHTLPPVFEFLHGSFVLPKPSSLPTYRLPLPLAAHVPVKWLWVLHDMDMVHSLTARKSYASSGGSPRSCILWMLDYFVLRRNSIVGVWTPAVGQPGHRIWKPPCIQSHIGRPLPQ
jgi:hypothetical protein